MLQKFTSGWPDNKTAFIMIRVLHLHRDICTKTQKSSLRLLVPLRTLSDWRYIDVRIHSLIWYGFFMLVWVERSRSLVKSWWKLFAEYLDFFLGGDGSLLHFRWWCHCMLTHVGCLKTGRDHAETTRTSSNHTQRPPGAILYSAREPTVHCNPHTDTRTHTHFSVNASLLWKQRSKVVVIVIVVVFLRLTVGWCTPFL